MESENKETLSSPQSLRLPQELIDEEILPRLPAKSLLRFRCVSKPWRSLINSKRLIEKHLMQNYTSNLTCANMRVIMHCKKHGLNQHGPNSSSLRSYCDEPFVDFTPIDDPKNNHLMSSAVVVNACNGLFCIYKFKPSRSFFLWNPTTRVSIELPKPDFPNTPFRIRKWGFGWDEESGAYKVFVAMFESNDEGIGRVYSSKTNSWKRAEQLGDLSSLWDLYGKVAHGKIHWLTKSSHIETFDLKSEVFGMMEKPCKTEGEGSLQCLLESRGILMVVCINIKDIGNAKIRIWSMKEYGVKESWVEERYKVHKKINRCCTPIVYVESLVSPVLANEVFCSTSEHPIEVSIGLITRAWNKVDGLMMKFGLK